MKRANTIKNSINTWTMSLVLLNAAICLQNWNCSREAFQFSPVKTIEGLNIVALIKTGVKKGQNIS